MNSVCDIYFFSGKVVLALIETEVGLPFSLWRPKASKKIFFWIKKKTAFFFWFWLWFCCLRMLRWSFRPFPTVGWNDARGWWALAAFTLTVVTTIQQRSTNSFVILFRFWMYYKYGNVGVFHSASSCGGSGDGSGGGSGGDGADLHLIRYLIVN